MGTDAGGSIWKAQIRHGTPSCGPDFRLAMRQAGEEFAQLRPHFCSAGEAFPVHANQADQLVAFVDGEQVVLGGGVSAGIAQAVDQQAFHVGFHFVQNRIALDNVVPGFQRQQRFGRARRAGIERDDAILQAVRKKKAMLMGTIRPFHSASVRLKLGREGTRRGTRLNFYLSRPLKRMAQASQVQRILRCGEFDQVGMIGRKPTAAQFAAFERPRAALRERVNWRRAPKAARIRAGRPSDMAGVPSIEDV